MMEPTEVGNERRRDAEMITGEIDSYRTNHHNITLSIIQDQAGSRREDVEDFLRYVELEEGWWWSCERRVIAGEDFFFLSYYLVTLVQGKLKTW